MTQPEIKSQRLVHWHRDDDRAHRIGQNKPVFVYRLVAAGTDSLENVLQICTVLGISLTIQPWESGAEESDDWQ